MGVNPKCSLVPCTMLHAEKQSATLKNWEWPGDHQRLSKMCVVLVSNLRQFKYIVLWHSMPHISILHLNIQPLATLFKSDHPGLYHPIPWILLCEAYIHVARVCGHTSTMSCTLTMPGRPERQTELFQPSPPLFSSPLLFLSSSSLSVDWPVLLSSPPSTYWMPPLRLASSPMILCSLPSPFSTLLPSVFWLLLA